MEILVTGVKGPMGFDECKALEAWGKIGRRR